jgi:hypothetical protein
MIGGLKRWSVWAQRSDDSEWIEVCHCDRHPEQLRHALILKGYARAGIKDNWAKFVRDGQIDTIAAMKEIFGLKFKYVKPDDPPGAAP